MIRTDITGSDIGQFNANLIDFNNNGGVEVDPFMPKRVRTVLVSGALLLAACTPGEDSSARDQVDTVLESVDSAVNVPGIDIDADEAEESTTTETEETATTEVDEESDDDGFEAAESVDEALGRDSTSTADESGTEVHSDESLRERFSSCGGERMATSMEDFSYKYGFFEQNPELADSIYDVTVTDSEYGMGQEGFDVLTEYALVNPNTDADGVSTGNEDLDTLFTGIDGRYEGVDSTWVNGDCRQAQDKVSMPSPDLPRVTLKAGSSVEGVYIPVENLDEFKEAANNVEKFRITMHTIENEDGEQVKVAFVTLFANGCDNPIRLTPPKPPVETPPETTTTVPETTTTVPETTTTVPETTTTVPETTTTVPETTTTVKVPTTTTPPPPVTTVPETTTTVPETTTTVPETTTTVPETTTTVPETTTTTIYKDPTTTVAPVETTIAPTTTVHVEQPSTTIEDVTPPSITIVDEVPTPSTVYDPNGSPDTIPSAPPVTVAPPADVETEQDPEDPADPAGNDNDGVIVRPNRGDVADRPREINNSNA